MPNDTTITTAYPQEGDSDDLLEKRRTKGIADLLAAFGSGSTSGPGSTASAGVVAKQIRRRKNVYTSNAVDQTLDLDAVTGVAGGKVKSFAIDLVSNGDPQKRVRLTNSLGEIDDLGSVQAGVFLKDLAGYEYVSEIGSLFIAGTDSNNRNIVHLTWSEEV